MAPKVVKTTSKGQITLPKSWRDQFHTDSFLMQVSEKHILLKPIDLHEFETDEEIIFDADRDNKGKGVSPEEMIRLLKKTLHG